MTDSSGSGISAELDAAERAAASSARRHVGAAGFAQTSILEQIIAAGREQIAVTRSLRRVVAATEAQLRDLSQGPDAERSSIHVAALDSIVSSGQAQIEAATTLRQVIQTTLTNVQDTPLEEVSAGVLSSMSEVVGRQAASLKTIIAAAIQQAGSPEQISRLESVGTEAASQRDAAEHEQAERELVELERLGGEALQRIRSLEDGGVTLEAQRMQLEEDAQRSAQKIVHLEAAERHDLAEVTRLEEQGEALEERVAELEAGALRTQERLAELEPARQRDPTQDE